LGKSVFEGIRVLDIGHIVAGPIAASMLADFGAEVIKVERPGEGDSLRKLLPKNGVGLHSKVASRNKKSITLDLKQPEGRDIFLRLVAQSDVLVENFRPGVMERLGCGWDTLHALNPRLIMCRLSGFGQTGPNSHRRAFGRIGEAFSGFTHITGEADGPPMHSQMSIGDVAAGMLAAQGIMMALYWRDAQQGDKGQFIDLGLYEGLFRLIEQHIIVVDQLGKTMGRSGNQHAFNPFVSSYWTKDRGYFSVAAGTPDSARDVLRAIGLDRDPRFKDWDACVENIAAYHAAAAAWMAVRTLAQVVAAFAKYDAPGQASLSGADLIRDPHVLARDMVITVQDEELGPIRMQGIAPKLSETPGRVDHAGQAMGASNELIYGGLLGMTHADIAALQAKGVV
jgi:crotonobetainyl-CoA:carnitine CoA-transferase CaiB-like acyl-CoA transferase